MKMVSSDGRIKPKLTAPSESSESGPPDWADLAAEARALVKAPRTHAVGKQLAASWSEKSAGRGGLEADLLDLLLD
jgi:hypothetical protein